WLFQAMGDCAAAMGDELESKKHLLNARTTLLELSYNISDPEMRQHYLNRPDSRALLARTEDLEDLAYEGFPQAPVSPQATRALESIARINEQMHRRDSLKSTLELILDEAIQLSGAERGIVFLFDHSGREELKVSRNIGRMSLADARKYTRTALQRIRHGEIVFASDTLVDPQLSAAESITQLRIRSVACVPLRSRGSIIGALYLDSRRPRLAASEDLLKSLEIFAQQASSALERAIRYFHLAEENKRLRETAQLGVPTLIGQGTYFTNLKKLIVAASESDLPVLILGESGTGKELVARAVHYSGKRKTEPFLSVDCGALPENLIESELFGYCRGAFTGAERDKEGLFVAAQGGTLFLDEIGNTTLQLQAKLLRAIQEREIRPLGATQPISFQARIVTATNRDLRRDARDGRFRQDLLFRLNGIAIELPVLRDRKAEIPLLINHFLKKTRERYGHRIHRISDQAMTALARFDWPGNIRELENCIERAVALAKEETIQLADLPDSVRSASLAGWSDKRGEHRLIEEALLRFAGDKSRAADYIGWNRQKLYRKMEHYNIPMDFGRRNTA
ncbi:MAG TPA: sigma-54-dependent Fis family transcriptional regulator, partial [Candidatus Polarisedimenticolia bacterium]|nr:sigma-54-dependent Fis family transcriptional regulator [Candidatus Polarisedimenticolia bacterium]